MADELNAIKFRRDYASFDFVLLFLVLVLCVFGAVMVYSAINGHSESYLAANPSIAAIFPRHVIFLLLGVILLFAAAFIDFRFVCRFWAVYYIVNLLLLAVVLYLGRVAPPGVTVRWISLRDFGLPVPEWLGIQPSEFTKLFSIIYLAMAVDKFKDRLNELKILFPLSAAAALPVMLIILQPSLSAGIVSLSILVCVLFMGRIRFLYIFIAFIVGGILVFLIYYDLTAENPLLLGHLLPGGLTENGILKPFQVNRLRAHFGLEVDPWLLDQTNLSINAMMSGQLFGSGLLQNPVTVYVPHNDFIFAVIGAEFGFVGSVAVITVMFGVIFKCLYISHKTPIFYAKIIAASVGVMFAFQTFLNVSVVTGGMPNTGMTFPFISAGGSSMWINLASIGLVLNIGMTKQRMMFE
jgi:rod shape determining protein RodA